MLDCVVCKSVHESLMYACSSVRLGCLCTGVGNTTDTVHISTLIWCWATFFGFNTASVFLGMDSHKFWTVSSGSLYHFSWSYWRWKSVPHSSLRNWREWFSDVQIWWLCWPGKMLKFTFMLFDWTVPAVWMGTLSSWKTAWLFGNNV
jgi:hypothetical protein